MADRYRRCAASSWRSLAPFHHGTGWHLFVLAPAGTLSFPRTLSCRVLRILAGLLFCTGCSSLLLASSDSSVTGMTSPLLSRNDRASVLLLCGTDPIDLLPLHRQGLCNQYTTRPHSRFQGASEAPGDGHIRQMQDRYPTIGSDGSVCQTFTPGAKRYVRNRPQSGGP